ncbi:uncharacterized protein LOC6738207 isoform X1 [Drosophila simulans]|uniref:GD12532 n=2 Tax=Drosophila simulans TaxID=7240 RepID=B4QLQ6_DROSI|nr:uncharacterized protein LOC6738207 isoform X1 [Drosophila simulans]EDX10605.1 GD12532 [Drosophila simulans]KMY99838.1 uncharacterized protein Dsimw501_GD12532, isoform A [Drosophila simulans]
MAPQQQNSTFIDDNLDSCPSLLNLPESPILPPRRCQNQDTNNNNNNKQAAFEERLVDEPPSVGEPPLAPPIPLAIPMAPAPPHRQACKNKHGRENGNAGQASRRHRSISLYGVNSTVEQGHKEIPIWMDDGEARYVSGVTNKTTCDDIIKALIDDELRNGNGFYCGNNPKDGGQRKTAAASRDYSDYIITESWGGIERCYDGNMAILPVWRAWSRVHNELRISLKHRDSFRDPLAMQLVPHSQPATGFSMYKWLKKLLHLKKGKKTPPKPTKTPPKVPNKLKEKRVHGQKQTMPNDLVLVIMPDQLYRGTENTAKSKLYKLAENRISKQRHRRRSRHEITKASVETFRTAIPSECNNNNYNVNNCIMRRKDKPLRNSVRYKLASLHADMNVRYEKEHALTRQLSEMCRLYRLQNERYKGPEMELSVGQLQQNIEAYAEDIIKTEHELLELKNEIKHDISLINNLKRLTLEESEADAACKRGAAKVTHPSQENENTPQVAKNMQEMQFVDNIYEFCDNNASMLV